jgi:glycosyltransferase involved in cell wall biosynthesis
VGAAIVPRRVGISVVVTTLNDAEGLAYLLPALDEQDRPPDEVLFVDGGSTDETSSLIEEWCARTTLTGRLLRAPGANISAGRNRGVQAAGNGWIACTDAGCRPARGWLAAIGARCDEADFVAGIYLLDARTDFERALAVAMHPSPDEIAAGGVTGLLGRLFGRRFDVRGATGRSMAFTREAWAAVGGFPETLYAGEDVDFSASVVDSGFRSVLEPAAVVHWRPRATWGANAKMFWHYGRGGVRGRFRRRYVVRIGAWAAASIGWLAGPRWLRAGLAALGGAYLGLPLVRVLRSRVPFRVWWRLPFLAAMKDLAQIAGSVAGLIDERAGRNQPPPSR